MIRVLVGLLVVFVLAYTLFGAMLAFNLWGTADRISRIPLDLTVWRRNNRPGSWRMAGLIILAFDVVTLALLAVTVK